MEEKYVENVFEQEIVNEDLGVGLEVQEENLDAFKVNKNEQEIENELFEATELEEIILGGEEIGCDLNSVDTGFEVGHSSGNFSEDMKTKTQQELEKYYNSIRCDRIVGVYVKTNSEGYIIDVKSDMFNKNLEGYTKIDEGEGDRFYDAENLYFEEPLRDEKGNFRYKL